MNFGLDGKYGSHVPKLGLAIIKENTAQPFALSLIVDCNWSEFLYQISGTQISLLHALVSIQSKAWPLIVVLLYKYVDSGLFGAVEPLLISSLKLCQGRGGPMSPVWILRHLVSVFINACRLLSALPSLSQFGRGRLSLVTILFYALSLLFGPCRLSEFTLAGPPPW